MFDRFLIWMYGKEVAKDTKDLLLHILLQVIGVGVLLYAINNGIEKTFG